MSRVIVTGYTGFVGKNLVPYLKQEGFNVMGIGRELQNGLAITQYTYEQLPQVKNYNAMIHLAGKAHDLKQTVDANAYFEINTQLTINVFKHFLNSEATDFIYLSSVKAVADSVADVLYENVTPAPATAYGQSKLLSEEYLLNQQLPAEKRVFILRPCMIHGPGNKGNLNRLYSLIKKRMPYPLAAFDNKRSLLSVNNLLFAIKILLLNTGIPGGVYNIADDEPLSTNDIIDILGKASHIDPLKWDLSPSFIKTLAKAGDKLRLPFNTENLQKLTGSYVVSNNKFKQAAGIHNMPVNAREGIYYTAQNLHK